MEILQKELQKMMEHTLIQTEILEKANQINNRKIKIYGTDENPFLCGKIVI